MPENYPHRPVPTAVILAGGLGTRIRGVVSDRPKTMALVCGRPFIEFLFDQIAHTGIDRVVICTGHMGSLIQSSIGDHYRSMRIEYSHESEPLGTGGALRNALTVIPTNLALVMNGDSYLEGSLAEYLNWHYERGAAASLRLVKVKNSSRYGAVSIGKESQIKAFNEKAKNGAANWINAGIYLLSRSIIATIPETGAVSLETDIFPGWLNRGLFGFKSEGRFIDIGTPQSYQQAQEFFKKLATIDRRPQSNFKIKQPSMGN